ncbi:MAG TPA: LysM peptidoglycan-binding domain-containing protein [Acidimicrobiales bacterium]|nr:LysM peptidoglycan-binding domain-containing protein [Acidimicrobiales bacterium]
MTEQMPTKAFLQPEVGDAIPCRFNPTSFSMSASNTWAPRGGPGRTPGLIFTGGGSGTMSLDLFLDTTDTGRPVTDHTQRLLHLMEIDTSIEGYDETKMNGRPPWVEFHWGDFHSFKAVITSVTLNYTYFSSDGVPLRATAGLQLTQYEHPEDLPPQNPTSGTPKPHRVHRVTKGETLDRIAAQHYGDPTQWRRIAAANTIHDPLELRPGSLITIPRLSD